MSHEGAKGKKGGERGLTRDTTEPGGKKKPPLACPEKERRCDFWDTRKKKKQGMG